MIWWKNYWPPKSCNLTPLVYFLWALLKKSVMPSSQRQFSIWRPILAMGLPRYVLLTHFQLYFTNKPFQASCQYIASDITQLSWDDIKVCVLVVLNKNYKLRSHQMINGRNIIKLQINTRKTSLQCWEKS